MEKAMDDVCSRRPLNQIQHLRPNLLELTEETLRRAQRENDTRKKWVLG